MWVVYSKWPNYGFTQIICLRNGMHNKPRLLLLNASGASLAPIIPVLNRDAASINLLSVCTMCWITRLSFLLSYCGKCHMFRFIFYFYAAYVCIWCLVKLISCFITTPLMSNRLHWRPPIKDNQVSVHCECVNLSDFMYTFARTMCCSIWNDMTVLFFVVGGGRGSVLVNYPKER